MDKQPKTVTVAFHSVVDLGEADTAMARDAEFQILFMANGIEGTAERREGIEFGDAEFIVRLGAAYCELSIKSSGRRSAAKGSKALARLAADAGLLISRDQAESMAGKSVAVDGSLPKAALPTKAKIGPSR